MRIQAQWPMLLLQNWTMLMGYSAASVDLDSVTSHDSGGDPVTTANTGQIAVRLDFDSRAPAFSRALAHLDNAATKQLDAVDFDPRLRELVRIRASQLNGCAYCIDMHTKDARAAGETEQRIYALPAWRETPFFTTRERAALAFTESVTLLAQTHVPARAYDELAADYSPDEIAALVSLIVVINAWNTVGVSTRAWLPGSYEP
jgi:AhpD family alkylhydroperoxidase